MKKLCLDQFDEQIDIVDPSFITIAIEDRSTYLKCLEYLMSEFSSLNKPFFSLTGCDDELDECAIFIQSPVLLDINTKRNLNSLTKILKKAYFEEINSSIVGIKEAVGKAVDEIKMDFEVELETSFDLKTDDVLKVANIRFKEEEFDLVELFCKYVSIAKELNGINIVFASHLRDFFSDEELENIVAELSYKGISIVNIESFEHSTTLKIEKRVIIDADQCIIS